MNRYGKPIVLVILSVVVIGSAYLMTRVLENYNSDEETSVSETQDQSDLEKAADFTVYNSDNEEVSLSDFEGMPVYINFWASWCSPCKSELPYIQEDYEKYGDQIEFFMVNLTDGSRETKSSAQEYVDSMEYTFPMYFDLDLDAVNTYNITGIPMHYFIDKDGNIQNIIRGGIGSQTLETQLKSLIDD